jgi:hypothetical protein
VHFVYRIIPFINVAEISVPQKTDSRLCTGAFSIETAASEGQLANHLEKISKEEAVPNQETILAFVWRD